MPGGTRRPRGLAVTAALVLAVGLSACGGGDGSTRGRAQSASQQGGEAGTTTTSAPAAGDAQTPPTSSVAPISAPPGALGAPAMTGAPTQAPWKLGVTLRSRCVRVGDRQAITVTGPPGAVVAYGSTYSDGNNGLTSQSTGFYGGNHHGRLDDKGQWSHEWVISTAAAKGRVTVDVAGLLDRQHDYVRVEFLLVGAGESCPA